MGVVVHNNEDRVPKKGYCLEGNFGVMMKKANLSMCAEKSHERRDGPVLISSLVLLASLLVPSSQLQAEIIEPSRKVKNPPPEGVALDYP
jgi:hypothetical protein